MSESKIKFSYYQFQKELGYEVYLRFEDFDFENKFTEVLEIMGFDKVKRDDIKDHNFNRKHTKILKIVKATPRVARQINRPDFAFDKYGAESFSQMGNYDVYRYKNVAMMILGEGNFLWELGIKNTEDQSAIRTVLTRYLSFALASKGVVGFWGVPVDEGFVVMSPKAANFESIFIDLEKDVLITYNGKKEISSELQILRLDSTLRNEMKRMKGEELLSFLSMNTAHLSYSGMSLNLQKTILELSQVAHGFIYPENNFKPRIDGVEA